MAHVVRAAGAGHICWNPSSVISPRKGRRVLMHFATRLMVSSGRILPALLAGLLLAAAAPAARGAVVTWGAATSISGDLDVSTAGTLVGAFNVGNTGVSSTTVNTVNFQSFAVPNGTLGPVTVGNFTLASGGGAFGSTNIFAGGGTPFSTLSSNYQTLLAADVQANGTPSITLTMSALSVGAQYQFQWWSNISISDTRLTTAAAGGSVTLSSNTTGGGQSGLGQYALGTFTANALPQAITFTGFAGDPAFLNGFQLRQLAPAGGGGSVPLPPAVWSGLIAVAGMAGFAMRRWVVA